MNILYIITRADSGGAQKYVLALAKHFKGCIAAGDEADELFIQAKKDSVETYKIKSLKRNINPFQDLLALWEIRQLVQNLKPDIIHLNSTKAGIFGSFACIGLKTKVVFTAHGFIFNEPRPWPIKAFFLALEKVASSYRDYIISVSEADRSAALKFGVISANKISVIYNGLSPINFYPPAEARQKLNLDSEKIIIGTVANFYKTKGLDVLIKAIGLLPASIQEKCQFTIIGSGPEKEDLQKINHQLQAGVLFSGNVPNASQYMRAFDVFVLPSRKEGFPYAILEALQAGLPIVAADVGGVLEALGEAGILTPPENPQALAEAITNLVSRPDLRKDFSNKALIRSKKFTWGKMLEETENVYKKLLA